MWLLVGLLVWTQRAVRSMAEKGYCFREFVNHQEETVNKDTEGSAVRAQKEMGKTLLEIGGRGSLLHTGSFCGKQNL